VDYVYAAATNTFGARGVERYPQWPGLPCGRYLPREPAAGDHPEPRAKSAHLLAGLPQPSATRTSTRSRGAPLTPGDQGGRCASAQRPRAAGRQRGAAQTCRLHRSRMAADIRQDDGRITGGHIPGHTGSASWLSQADRPPPGAGRRTEPGDLRAATGAFGTAVRRSDSAQREASGCDTGGAFTLRNDRCPGVKRAITGRPWQAPCSRNCRRRTGHYGVGRLQAG